MPLYNDDASDVQRIHSIGADVMLLHRLIDHDNDLYGIPDSELMFIDPSQILESLGDKLDSLIIEDEQELTDQKFVVELIRYAESNPTTTAIARAVGYTTEFAKRYFSNDSPESVLQSWADVGIKDPELQ